MGVESGLPDFRGPEGFWRAYPALGQRGLHFADIASPSTFETQPALAWGFYGHRLNLYRNTVPHQGFQILRGWGERMFNGYGVFQRRTRSYFSFHYLRSGMWFHCFVLCRICIARSHFG